MTIESEITRINTNIANAYSSAEEKGATLPSVKNSANLSACIDSITGGGGGSKFGMSIDNFIGDLDANGKLNSRNVITGTISFNGVKDIGQQALYNSFYNNNNFQADVIFPDLETISGSNALGNAFASSAIKSISFPKLETITGGSALTSFISSTSKLTSVSFLKLKRITSSSGGYQMTYGCSQLTSVELPELEELSGSNSGGYLVGNCVNITTIRLPKLKILTGSSCLSYGFAFNTKLTDVYFNGLTTSSFGTTYKNQFSNLMSYTGSSTVHRIHFPSNMIYTISQLTGYPLFGGTTNYVSLVFDLPATS